LKPVSSIGQVVEGSEEQRHVHTVVLQVELPGVGDRGIDDDVSSFGLTELLDMEGNEVAMNNPVAKLGQPLGITPGPTGRYRPPWTLALSGPVQ
jgi:hypothetical protein